MSRDVSVKQAIAFFSPPKKDTMKRILITGGAGFVGSNIAIALSKTDHTISVIDDLSFGNSDNLRDLIYPPFRKTDFNDLSTATLNHFDILIHTATANINYAITHPIETFKINALNTIDLFKRFKGQIIYTSTASVYGQADVLPTSETAKLNVYNAYDQSKLIAEKFLEQRGNYTTLRLSNVFGVNQRPDNPYGGVIAKFIYAILKGEPVKIYGDGLATRDYTYVSDVVRAVEMVIEQSVRNSSGDYHLMYHKRPCNTYNVSGGNEISTLDLAKKISKMLGEKRFYAEHRMERKIDKIDRRLLDTSLIEKELGWKPLYGWADSFEKGLIKTIEWIKKEYRL